MSDPRLRYCLLESPLGPILVAGDDVALTLINFQAGAHPVSPGRGWVKDPNRFRDVAEQLSAYFAGTLRRFDLVLASEGTSFQREVWHALEAIPYGQTISYGELARRVGRPRAARAVGAANGRNPLPVVVPCHRVIGADGSLTGYGGGLWIKEALLDAEQRGGAVAPVRR